MKSLLLQTRKGTDNRQVLEFVHDMYHELGIQDLTVQTEDAWVAAASYLSSFPHMINGDDIFRLAILSIFQTSTLGLWYIPIISNMFLSVDDCW